MTALGEMFCMFQNLFIMKTRPCNIQIFVFNRKKIDEKKNDFFFFIF